MYGNKSITKRLEIGLLTNIGVLEIREVLKWHRRTI